MVTAKYPGEPVDLMLGRLQKELVGIRLEPRRFYTKSEKRRMKELENEKRKAKINLRRFKFRKNTV